jgi:hypothetical protein
MQSASAARNTSECRVVALLPRSGVPRRPSRCECASGIHDCVRVCVCVCVRSRKCKHVCMYIQVRRVLCFGVPVSICSVKTREVLDTWCLTLGAWHLVLDTWCLTPGRESRVFIYQTVKTFLLSHQHWLVHISCVDGLTCASTYIYIYILCSRIVPPNISLVV